MAGAALTDKRPDPVRRFMLQNQNTVPAYWHGSVNVGDALTMYLIKAISGKLARKVEIAELEHKYLVTGSIMSLSSSHTTVWGAGIAWRHDPIDPHADIRAVRGPITRARALECGARCPEVYGDPALLLPRLYAPKAPARRYELGVIPHIIDRDDHRVAVDENLRMIDVTLDAEPFVDAVCSCDNIVSSSLHGLIIATAYGIPCRWVVMSDKIIGDGTKFVDFFASVGIEQEPFDMRQKAAHSQSELLATVPPFAAQIDTDALWEACPFRG